MDCRNTLAVNETFIPLLNVLWRSDERVHLLVDDNGIDRKEGLIHHIDEVNSIIELGDGSRIELKRIVAVNGVFLPEFGEC